MQDVTAADRITGHHGDHRLGQPPDLDLKIEHIEPTDAALGDRVIAQVAIVAPDHLVAAGAEGPVALPGEDDDPDLVVVARHPERPLQLEEGLRSESVALLGSVDGDLGDAVGDVVGDVGEVP